MEQTVKQSLKSRLQRENDNTTKTIALFLLVIIIIQRQRQTVNSAERPCFLLRCSSTEGRRTK